MGSTKILLGQTKLSRSNKRLGPDLFGSNKTFWSTKKGTNVSIFDQNLFGSKFYVTKKLLDQNILLIKKFFWPKIIGTNLFDQNLFGLKNCVDTEFSYIPNFVDQIFFGQYFIGSKYFRIWKYIWPEIFLNLKCFHT